MKLEGIGRVNPGVARRSTLLATGAAVAAGALAGCAAAPAPLVSSPTTGRPFTSAPTVSEPALGSSLAVVEAEIQTQPAPAGAGLPYDVLLVDTSGHVVASAPAKEPQHHLHQTVNPSLISASTTRAYFRDGDTKIMSLTPSGAVTLVKTILAGTGASVAFSVSPDDTRIAVAVIDQSVAPITGYGYVEDLHDAGDHRVLWSNTGNAAERWPVGWHSGDVVDQVGPYCSGGDGDSGCSLTVGYHVIDPVTGSRVATVCQTSDGPNGLSGGASSASFGEGPLAASGVACLDVEPGETTLSAIDWNGRARVFANVKTGTILHDSICWLSTDGSLMACLGDQSALVLRTPGGTTKTISPSQFLGWMDASHMLTYVAAPGTLGILDVIRNTVTTLSIVGVARMTGVIPGSL